MSAPATDASEKGTGYFSASGKVACPLFRHPPVSKALRRFAWGGLGYVILVVLWGAYVRATGSGAGCGDHWPLCNGEVLPREPGLQTIIEFTHRLTSGLAGIFSVALLIWTWRGTQRGHPMRALAVASLVFMILEGAVGAGLVLFQLVADNPSLARAWAMSAHLVNTFLLLAVMVLTARAASGGSPVRLEGQGGLLGLAAGALGGLLLLGMSGAITALGDTLFPAASLREGIAQDLSPTSHVLLRLRVLHPVIAVLAGLLAVGAAWMTNTLRPSAVQRRWALALSVLYGVQFLAGLLNVYLLAPVWLQIVHLLLADALWLVAVLTFASALSTGAPMKVGAVGDVAPTG